VIPRAGVPGCGELLPFCPDCATHEFAPDASAGGHASRPEHTRESWAAFASAAQRAGVS